MLEGEKAELYNLHKWKITYFRKVKIKIFTIH